MNSDGVESIFQVYTGHPAVWPNDFENIRQGFYFKMFTCNMFIQLF